MIKELVPATQRAAQLLRVRVEPLGVREPDDFGSALAAMTRTRPDALTTLNRQKVVDFAAAQRIPAMYEVAATVRGGGLMSYGGDVDKSFALVARYVDRILKGAKPAELPVEQPNRYLLTINLKTAKTLGLTIPPALLARVDEVVE